MKSTYNIWFNGSTGGSEQLVGSFTLNVGDNIIPIRTGATHFALSNTTAGMEGTYVYALTTYDDFMKLKAVVDANTEAIENIEQEGTSEKHQSCISILNFRSGIKLLNLTENPIRGQSHQSQRYKMWFHLV